MKSMISKIFHPDNKNVFWSFASKGFAAVAFILVDVYLARTLQVEQYGEWQYFFSTLSIAFVVTFFGIPQAAQTYAARYNGKKQLRPVLSSSLWLRVLVSLVFTILVVLIRKPLANMIHQPDFARLLLLSAPLIFLMGLSEHLKNVFVGLKTVVNHFVMNIIEFGLKLGLVVVLLMMVKDLQSVVNAYTLAILASVLVGLWLLYRIYRSAPPGDGEFGEFFKAVFRYSLPLSLISIGLVVMTELNTQILGVLTTAQEVAIFGVGKQLTNKLPQISLALSMGTMPQFAQIEAHMRDEMRRRFFKLQRLNLLIFTPIVLALIVFSPFAVPLVYGVEYKEAVLPLQILSLRLLISTTIIFTNSFLDYQGMAGKRAFNFMVSIIFDVVLNLYMIPRWGAVGAAIATMLSYIPYLVLNQIEVHRLFNKAADG